MEKVLVFLLWEHQHMREPAQWDFLIHQNVCWEKCVLLLKSTWQSARGFFLSVQTEGACKQKLLKKILSQRILWILQLSFPFNATLSRDVSFARCLRGDAFVWTFAGICARNFYQTQNVLPILSYEGRVHWAFFLSFSLSLCLFQVPAIFQLMYFECLSKDIPINNHLVLWRFFPAKISGQYVHYLLPTRLLELFWPANNGWEYRQFSCYLKQIGIKLSNTQLWRPDPWPLNIQSSCFHKKNDYVSLGNHLCFHGSSFDLVAMLGQLCYQHRCFVVILF